METRWIRVRRESRDGKACRVIAVHDATGAPELEAVAFTWQRDIVVLPAESARIAGFTIRRRRLFPLTGALDVVDVRDGRRLGILFRSGRVADATGQPQGRFRDARTAGDRAGETAFEFVGAIVTGTEGGDPGRMPAEQRWLVGGREQGRLMRVRWPFAAAREDPAAGTRGLARFLPSKLSAFLRSASEPTTWRFDWTPLELPVDPRLPVAAAVWAVELSHW